MKEREKIERGDKESRGKGGNTEYNEGEERNKRFFEKEKIKMEKMIMKKVMKLPKFSLNYILIKRIKKSSSIRKMKEKNNQF